MTNVHSLCQQIRFVKCFTRVLDSQPVRNLAVLHIGPVVVLWFQRRRRFPSCTPRFDNSWQIIIVVFSWCDYSVLGISACYWSDGFRFLGYRSFSLLVRLISFSGSMVRWPQSRQAQPINWLRFCWLRFAFKVKVMVIKMYYCVQKKLSQCR